MKIGEIIRIIVISVIGYIMMMLVQPWLYENKVFAPFRKIRFNEWLPQYNRAALIVFGVSVVFTLLWYILTLINQKNADLGFWRLIWYLGLGLLVIVISVSIYFNNQDDKGNMIQETLFSLMGLFAVDSLFILYWLPTVTSTPGLFKHRVVPGSNVINDLIGRK